MPTIGDTLREARMRQRLDIADVEQKTKIRAKYLRALENEEFGMLPGPTFVKTFLRTYAEALGLDPHMLVEAYRASYEPRDETEQLQPLGPAAGGRDRRRPRPPLGPWLAIGAVVLAVVAALLVIGLVGDDDDGEPERASQDTTESRFEGILEAPQTFRGRRLRVNLGNTSVEVTANRKRVDVGSGPDPVGFEFTPGRTTPLASGQRPCS